VGFRAGTLLLFPLLIMVIAIAVQQGNQAPNLQGSNTVQFCTSQVSTNCAVQNSIGTSYTCQPTASIFGLFPNCKILPSCDIKPPFPAFCISDPIEAGLAGCIGAGIFTNYASCGVWLPAGTYVFIPSSTINSDLTTTSALFGLSATGPSGFISLIFGVVAIVAILGLTVFSTGENSESIHILFMAALLLGIWGILSGLEGYLGGSTSPSEMFNSMNMMYPGFGTFVYVGLTLAYTLGIIGTVSRGSG
jgi:hypothetical protein